jgi:hypothetical protein
MVISGAVNGEVELDQRWRLGTEVSYTHRRPLNADDTMPDPSMPPDPGSDTAAIFLSRQNAVEIRPSLAHRLTMVDDLVFETGVGWEKYSSGIELYRVEPRLGWERRLRRERLLSVFGGVAYTRDVGQRSATGQEHYVSPVAEAMLEGNLRRWQQRTLSGSFGLQVEYYVDPVVAAAGPRALATTGLALGLGQNWQSSLDFAFGTSLKGDPLPGDPDETFVSLALPVRHRATPHLMLEAGLRFTDRAPHFGADDFDFHQRELWIYLAATATTFPIPAFVTPSVTSRSTGASQTSEASGGAGTTPRENR